jgi:hypothetical protein
MNNFLTRDPPASLDYRQPFLDGPHGPAAPKQLDAASIGIKIETAALKGAVVSRRSSVLTYLSRAVLMVLHLPAGVSGSG